MTGLQGFVQLHRTFSTLSQKVDRDTYDPYRLPYAGQRLSWADILQRPRAVILSEAGAGKTEEIRAQARRLRSEGKAAFFVRLEHVTDEFESAFEEGNFEEFENWTEGLEEGWLLLDSVDEARLRSPQDFDKAIRIVARRLMRVMSRVHVIVTSRPYAWRAQTDLQLCKRLLPVTADQGAVTSKKKSEDPGIFRSIIDDQSNDEAFAIVSLNDLDRNQVDLFVQARSPGNKKAFHDDVERADAWSFTTRPQDLKDLLEFWLREGRIGSRLELTRSSIRRRLSERNESHANAQPLTTERLQAGVRLMAAACILTRNPAIRLPGSEEGSGIHINEVLFDWNPIDQAALLARPIFDPAIYGAVRFYHRSVREYLCAEWISSLLNSHSSRVAVENLFFREQYGIEVVVPELRGVLPWLSISDDIICAKVLRLAPRVFFEGGDPSALSVDVRRKILTGVAADIAANPSKGIVDNAGIERFAASDISGDVKSLIKFYLNNHEVVWFLLRMVWQGRLLDALPEAKSVALNPKSERYARVAAFRAVAAVGTASDFAEIRIAFLTENDVLERVWLDELATELEASIESVNWLLEAISKSAPLERDRVDNLRGTIEDLIDRFPSEFVIEIVDRLVALLTQPPFCERHDSKISQQYSWLIRPAARGAAKLIVERRAESIRPSILTFLQILANSFSFSRGDTAEVIQQLSDQIYQWPDMKWALVWWMVDAERTLLDSSKNQRLTSARFLPAWPSFIRFSAGDFDLALIFCRTKPFIDDRLIALHVAYDAYAESGRKESLRRRLKRAAGEELELRDHLSWLMKRQTSKDMQKIKKSNAAWARRMKSRELLQAQNAEKNRRFIEENLEKEVIHPDIDVSKGVTPAQRYLIDKARDAHSKNEAKYGQNNWEALIPEFGETIAKGYRSAAISVWRRTSPVLISEGAPLNTTPYSVILGLNGLAIEASEEPDWLKEIDDRGIESAFRHAMHEINGFPAWLPQLYGVSPDRVRKLIVKEVEYEIGSSTSKAEMNYIIADLASNGQWIWDDVSGDVVELLRARDPDNLNVLSKLMTIIQGSSFDDVSLAKLAANKAHAAVQTDFAATWFAAWVGAEPEVAIEAVRKRLEGMSDREDAVRFATVFISQLVGSRYGRAASRGAYLTAEHLKSLYLLVLQYLPEKDDGGRPRGSVSSIGLSDEAEEARSSLLVKLRETPGKAAFTALMDLATEHPSESYRAWLLRFAHNRAEADANGEPWTPVQVREFNDRMEKTPANNRDLFDLAVMRLHDIKHDLENGDSSEAPVLSRVENETELRNVLGNRLRLTAQGRYSIAQEDEYSDGKRADIRFHCATFDAPVPAELKLSHRWSAAEFHERLENQLCGDYLRDVRSGFGIFLVVHQGLQKSWKLPDGTKADFDGLMCALRKHWTQISPKYRGVNEICIIGINLTLRKA